MNFESTSNRPISHTANRDQEGVDYVKHLFMLLSKWHWFALALILALLGAVIYNKYTPATWRVTTTVLIGEGSSTRNAEL